MSDNHPFYRLAPFIQEYIYRHNWSELRSIQVEACHVLFDTPYHLILAAGTASGKTEAAFLPILTSLYEAPPASIGALYIGPTKALINDQFLRLEGLLEEAQIPVWAWHGDVSATRKRKLMEKPQGVLQITPESLESLLLNRRTYLQSVFGELRFVVIDEIHVFMASDRGRQVLCQLERLAQFMQHPPRRIGLSATLGDYSAAERWLQASSSIHTETVTSERSGRVRLSVEHFYRDAEDENIDAYDQYIFARTQERKKTLIFGNSRKSAEEVITTLRDMARRQKLPDIYHVHHGSIAAPLRESAESAMKHPDQPAVTAATVTLELGIDIGQLERVIQLESPFSVASFLQRLGRSGRRGDPSEMWFVCAEEQPSAKQSLPKTLPWALLQSIAIIQLYVEERWIEPIRPMLAPFSLLYHQTVSVLAGGERSPADLARRILTLSPFRAISQNQFRTLLLHLIETDHMERLENGNLILGLAGEKVVRNFRFYAVFQDNEEYVVREERGEIGRIMQPPPVGDTFALAGRTWQVLDLNEKQRVVFVKRIRGRAKAAWMGNGGSIHTRVLQRMQRVLQESVQYSYLQTGAQTRLATAREVAQMGGIERRSLIELGGDQICYFPWFGTQATWTLMRCLAVVSAEANLNITVYGGKPPYYIILNSPNGKQAIENALQICMTRKWNAAALLDGVRNFEVAKYDCYIPEGLLKEGFSADMIDFSFQP